jgi:hypothetical protein
VPFDFARLAIQRAAEGDHHALDFLLRGFIEEVKKGSAPDPEVARVVADVLERLLAGEAIGEVLGTKAKRGRPREYQNAIVVHAAVQAFILRSQVLGRTQRLDDAQAAAAEALGMPHDTVRENYNRVSRLIKTVKDLSPFFDFKRNGFSVIEWLYLRNQQNAFLLLDIMAQACDGGLGPIGQEMRMRWVRYSTRAAPRSE